jgi:hypothetical protein
MPPSIPSDPLTQLFGPPRPEAGINSLDSCLAILRALGVTELGYYLSGGGDQGTAELETVRGCDGEPIDLPDVTIRFDDFGNIHTLAALLDPIVENIPDGDWINNEGGSGTVTLYPFEDDPVECCMEYGSYDDEEEADFEDEEDFDDSGADDPAPGTADTPPAIDDSALATPSPEDQP